MATTPTVYVICDQNCKFVGMTKEQILTAIMQAVESGTITNVDAGFITTLKTINNHSIKFFYGEQAEYDALTEDQKKNVFAIITNDPTKESLTNALDAIISGRLSVHSATFAQYAYSDGEGNEIKKTYAPISSLTGGALIPKKARSDIYGNAFETKYLHIDAKNDEFAIWGDPVNGFNICGANAANGGSTYLAYWVNNSNGTIFNFGLVWWDGKSVAYSPVSMPKTVNGEPKQFAVKITYSYEYQNGFNVGVAKVVQFTANGAEETLAVSGTTLALINLTDGYKPE